MRDDLVARLRAFARRHEVHSPERRLFIEAAEALEEGPRGITADAVEQAMGGRKLLKWQRVALDTPPSISGQ